MLETVLNLRLELHAIGLNRRARRVGLPPELQPGCGVQLDNAPAGKRLAGNNRKAMENWKASEQRTGDRENSKQRAQLLKKNEAFCEENGFLVR